MHGQDVGQGHLQACAGIRLLLLLLSGIMLCCSQLAPQVLPLRPEPRALLLAAFQALLQLPQQLLQRGC